MAVSYFVLEEDGTSHLDLEESTDSLILEEAGPANDNFASAIALSTTLPANLSGTTIEATQESGEDNSPPYFSGTYTSQSVWYTFTPSSTGRYRFTCTPDAAAITGSVHKRIAIDLSTASAVNAITVLKYDRFDGSGSEETFWQCSVEADLTASTTYHIRISSQNLSGDVADQRSMDFDLDWFVVGPNSPPSNDNLGSAHDLGTDPADGLKHSGTTLGATVESGLEDSDWPATWYKFETGGAGAGAQEIHVAAPDMTHYRPYWELYEVTTDPPTAWAHLSFVTNGDINDPFPHAIEDNWDALASPTLLNSTKYRIVVSNWDFNGTTGDYELHFGPYVPTPPPSAPDNDDADTVGGSGDYELGLSVWNDGVTDGEATHRVGTTTLATAQAGEPSKAGFAATRSVWYRMRIPTPNDYKVWVESSVDCVLALYEHDGSGADWHGITFGPGTEVYSDDDSGPGNQPEIIVNNLDIDPELEGYNYWVAVDSKTEGDFELHFERIPTGTRPANDDLDDAITIVKGTPISGTTVNAYAESRETDAEMFEFTPVATVWYKFVAAETGSYKLAATVDSEYDYGELYLDVFQGTSYANLVRLPPRSDKAWFSSADTPENREEQALSIPIVSGQTYYIRASTQSHSEDFTLYLDLEAIYLDLQVISTLEEFHGTFLESATIPLDLQVFGTDELHGTYLDADTVLVDVQPGGSEFMADTYYDAATVSLNLEGYEEHECFFHFEPSWTFGGERKWRCAETQKRWLVEGSRHWTWLEGEGLPQEC